MTNISIKIKVPKGLSNLSFSFWINKALIKSVNIVRNSAVKNAPYKTWTLRRSITTKVDDLQWFVWTKIKYAPIHEFWWIIKPKNSKFLKFKINWKRIFAKKVRIPARPYLQPAFFENKEKIKQIFLNELNKLI